MVSSPRRYRVALAESAAAFAAALPAAALGVVRTNIFCGAPAVNPAAIAIAADAPGRPVLTAPAGTTVLAMRSGSVQGIEVDVPAGASGVGIAAGSGVSLSDVRVTGPGPRAGAGATGIETVGAGVRSTAARSAAPV